MAHEEGLCGEEVGVGARAELGARPVKFEDLGVVRGKGWRGC